MKQSTHLTFKFSVAPETLQVSKLRMTMLGAALPQAVADVIFSTLDNAHNEIAERLHNSKREVRYDDCNDAERVDE